MKTHSLITLSDEHSSRCIAGTHNSTAIPAALSCGRFCGSLVDCGSRSDAVPMQAVLEGLDELWDESQYAEEFGLDAFVSKLSSSKSVAR